jgi:hypothetical protein
LTRLKVENGAPTELAKTYQHALAVLPLTGDQSNIRTFIETQLRLLGPAGKE